MRAISSPPNHGGQSARRSALVTGGAGFIGSHLVDRLLGDGWAVTSLDNFDPFYDPATKRANVDAHLRHPAFRLVEADVCDAEGLREALPGGYDVVVHLAAKAGVRPSIEAPAAYQRVNVEGTQVLLELAREWGTRQFVFASSSSVYGVSPDVPWRETEPGLRPISPYAATKVAGELLGHVYAHLYGVRFVALRFFTVYGPRQRPDLAIHKFARRMLAGQPIPLYGDGSTRRDYTFVDDVVDGIVAAMSYDGSPYEVINLGNSRTVQLSELVAALERALGVEAKVERLPPQPGDVPQTWAALDKAERLLGYKPRTALAEGLAAFAAWLQEHSEGEHPEGAAPPPEPTHDAYRSS
jgi:UDP-glucuronate 4-epimerase